MIPLLGEFDIWFLVSMVDFYELAELYPYIVYVFPVPVWPYAKSVALYPYSVDKTAAFAVF